MNIHVNANVNLNVNANANDNANEISMHGGPGNAMHHLPDDA